MTTQGIDACSSVYLQTAFQALKGPLAKAKARGGLINPWALASLNRDEVRNAATLADYLCLNLVERCL